MAQILQLLKLVAIEHQQLDGCGAQIRWNGHIDPTASDAVAVLYGVAKRKAVPLALTSHHPFLQLSGLTSSSQGLRPRLRRLSYYHNYPKGVGGSSRMAEAANV